MEVKESSARYLARLNSRLTETVPIPAKWEVRPLGEIAEIRTGIAKNSTISVSDPVLVHYLRVANVQDGFLDLSEMSKILVSRNDISRYAVLPGDMLMNEGGDLDQLGRGAVWHGEYSPCVHQNHVFVVRCGTRLFPDYLSAWTGGESARRYFMVAGKQTTNLASINKTALSQLPVALPPFSEQQSIANVLRNMDAFIESLEQLLSKKRNLKQGAMQELLTGKKKRLPGFGGEWAVERLGDVVEIVKGHLITEKDAVPGEVPVIAGGKRPSYFHNRANRIGKTITISGSGASAGYVAFFDSPIFASDCSTISEGASYSIRFIYFLLQLRQDDIYRSQTGGAQPHIHPNDLRPMIVHVPKVDEQTAIATILFDMDSEIATLETKVAKARQLKQGMMQELLTGRIRLVQPEANVVQFPSKAASVVASAKSHNWAINEAVVISVLAKNFGSEQWPLGRKRYTKLSYLLHRHVEGQAEGYLKKAAGPYNPATKYKGPEGIALKNGYVRRYSRDQFSGFVAADKIREAEGYFTKWYGEDALVWLEQFRLKTNDDLELLATVDMAMVDLRKAKKAEQLANVKRVIRDNPEWEAKLSRVIFSDEKIVRAMRSCQKLFGS